MELITTIFKFCVVLCCGTATVILTGRLFFWFWETLDQIKEDRRDLRELTQKAVLRDDFEELAEEVKQLKNRQAAKSIQLPPD